MRKIIMLASLLLSAGNAWANIVINGTRVLYPENNKEVIDQLRKVRISRSFLPKLTR